MSRTAVASADVAGRSRIGAIVSATWLAAGSLLTRSEAGIACARDPRCTAVPQRERLAARQIGRAPTVSR